MPNDEFIGNKANICIVGIGATGLHAVSGMAGQIQNVICIGLGIGPAESISNDSLRTINIVAAEDYQAVEQSLFMKIIEAAELVFLVANLDEIPAEFLRLCARRSSSGLSGCFCSQRNCPRNQGEGLLSPSCATESVSSMKYRHRLLRQVLSIIWTA